MYIADTDNHRIRFVSATTGILHTIAGNGSYGYNGDGIAATSASLAVPFRVAVDSSGSALTTKLVVLLILDEIILTYHLSLYR